MAHLGRPAHHSANPARRVDARVPSGEPAAQQADGGAGGDQPGRVGPPAQQDPQGADGQEDGEGIDQAVRASWADTPAIRATATTLMPSSPVRTQAQRRMAPSNRSIRGTNTNEGANIPMVATTAPEVPAIR